MKVAIIGAGSAFGSRISIDILSRKPIHDAHIALMDIDGEKVETVRAFVRSAIDHHGLPASVTCGTSRREALRDADFVIISVAIGGPAYFGKPFEDEFEIPAKYGIRQTVADTVGPGGVFRALRTGPVLIEMAEDINEMCPEAVVLNYTNPMAMLTWVLNEVCEASVIGLCHGVQGTTKGMAQRLGVPWEEVDYWVAGINHMAWILRFERSGEDLYPAYRQAAEDPEFFAKDPVRHTMMKQFGYFCTESSRHTSEYVPYFRNEDQWLDEYVNRTRSIKDKRHAWFEDMGVKASSKDSVELVRSHEFASGIMEAVKTGVPYRFNGNVMNYDLIDGLPYGCCVEVPCLVDGLGVHPCRVGALPPQCTALCRTNVNVQELAVTAILEGDREAAFHAIALDPITAASGHPLPKLREMFAEMWEAEKHLLEAYY
ncbi:alpha-galactosidase [bacterium]|nr:alpha-galactosidase [bacterium]